MFVGPLALSDAAFQAELYAKTHTGVPGDVNFYLRACTGSRSVLELGCGHGRVTGALARAGFDVTALELNRELVAYGEKQNHFGTAKIEIGNMSDFHFGRQFDRIVIPYSGIYCLPTDESVVAMLKCANEHLNDNGMLVFDAWASDGFHNDNDPTAQDDDEAIATISTTKGTFSVFESTVWERDAQQIQAKYRYEHAEAEPTIEMTIEHRYILSEQIAPLLGSAGLERLVVHGGFDQHVLDEESELIVVTAARTGI